MGYSEDRTYSDQFIPAMQQILLPFVLTVAPYNVDAQQCGDLVVLTADRLMIACRVRKPEFLERYGHEFTLRYSRSNGTITEFDKITRGWGHWLLYGFAHASGAPVLSKWTIINLHMFRYALIHRMVTPKVIPNRDGETEFAAFPILKIYRKEQSPPPPTAPIDDGPYGQQDLPLP